MSLDALGGWWLAVKGLGQQQNNPPAGSPDWSASYRLGVPADAGQRKYESSRTVTGGSLVCSGLAMVIALFTGTANAGAQNEKQKMSFEDYSRGCAVSRDVIDHFLAGPAWAKFDPELGYVQRDYVLQDGQDNSFTIYTFRQNGARTSSLYANRKPRINVYGDSFTESEQVNDGETWEEYLAGHIGEPIGNFGVGGYGVYQAYRRMIREEKTDHGAEYIIFYIWGDDPIRSLMRSRYCSIYRSFKEGRQTGGNEFQNNFWAHLEMDLETGKFVETENPLPTPQSLYHMTDPQWMEDHLKDDLALQLSAYVDGYTEELDKKQISKLAAALDFPFDWTLDTNSANATAEFPGAPPRTPMQAQAAALGNRYAQRATIYILRKVQAFARENRKKLLVVIFDPYWTMLEMHYGMPRSDQETVSYLIKEKIDYFDMNEVHIMDFTKYSISWDDYRKLYFIGHYNPSGNHFFAYSIKDKVVEMLDPKPVTYQNPNARTLDFKDYLPGYH